MQRKNRGSQTLVSLLHPQTYLCRVRPVTIPASLGPFSTKLSHPHSLLPEQLCLCQVTLPLTCPSHLWGQVTLQEKPKTTLFIKESDMSWPGIKWTWSMRSWVSRIWIKRRECLTMRTSAKRVWGGRRGATRKPEVGASPGIRRTKVETSRNKCRLCLFEY